MASLFMTTKSFDRVDSDGVEKKNDSNESNAKNHLRARSLDSMDKSPQDANSSIISCDNDVAMIEGGDSDGDKNIVLQNIEDGRIAIAAANCSWSKNLSTPSNSSSLFTPTSDIHSLKQNFHGLGLKYAIDRSKVLTKTGKGCASLLTDIATLHDELIASLNKLHPTILDNATANTPLQTCTQDYNGGSGISTAITSYITQTQHFGISLRTNVAMPYSINSSTLGEECTRQYTIYTTTRSKCGVARREGLKLRKRYVDCVRDVDVAIAVLKKARRSAGVAATTNNNKGGGGRKRTFTGSSIGSYSNTSKDEPPTSAGVVEEEEEEEGGAGDKVESTSLSSCWQDELRQYGSDNSLIKQCENVIRAHDEVITAQTNYTQSVQTENDAVDDTQNIEMIVLEAIQKLEEERIEKVVDLLERLLNDERVSLENMELDLTSAGSSVVEPLDLVVNGGSNVSQPTAAATTPSIFMSPRRRAQSDDGPAINETRLLNLPDKIATIRDNMKTLIGKQLSRLKTLKAITSYNDHVASAIEHFANSLKQLIQSNPCIAKMTKNEGTNVLNSWNVSIDSLKQYIQNLETLATTHIREANVELQNTLVSVERQTKLLQEREEYRWKSLCDASKVESKAKAKHKQYVIELEKAKANVLTLTVAEGVDGDDTGDGGDAPSDGGGGTATSPKKTKAPSTMMDQHMNKAMGKMFSAVKTLGGEDVMNKVLTPQQRQAIATRQLDEAQAKEMKGTESFELARSVKEQALASYETEAEACGFQCKKDERHEWSMMQTSLIRTVDALKVFRESQLNSVNSSIERMKEHHLHNNALDDVTRWTHFTEKRLKDIRDRNIISDTKDNNNDDGGQLQFYLKVQLVECTNIEETVRAFLDEDDEDVVDIDFVEEEEEEVVGTAAGGPESPLHNMNEANGDQIDTATTLPLPDVPPDSFIGQMDSIFSKTIKNVSIDEYYSTGWSEEKAPLYHPWLERKGSIEVSVSDWEHYSSSPDGVEFENEWSKEKFTQRRVIKFKFKRTTHLYIGPPIAGVTQTQYLIKEGNDKCIVMMTVEMDGIPYSDSFAVEVRWAARRLNRSDIAIDAGVVVRFIKSNMFASKIKSGTLKETAPIHLDLFEVIRSAIISSSSGERGGEGITEQESIADEGMAEEGNKEVVTNTPTEEVEPKSAVKGIIQFAASILSKPRNQQLILAIGLSFAAKMLFFRGGDAALTSAAQEMDHLSKKVDELTKEVREMKAMLELILKHGSD